MTAPRSGLQRQVLSLYRRALRIPRSKPETTRAKWDLMLRYTFRKQAGSVPPRSLSAIEHLLRAGERQVSMFEDKSVKDCWLSAEMREWEEAQKQRRN
ncbi:hypothetical protein FB45DRAFT_735560 [Roridomyces roridus]|uniref:Complex 1 LYR protein domain-containing protein n=1 Tax=Roridomyces roridus TaxID=1738132 RepID=A0AAD7CD91_9AGAR|nr:hypothetical protein FB45DRAFT_735560 [Roridomyces roridus]